MIKNLLGKTTLAALATAGAAIFAMADVNLPQPAPDDNLDADYKIRSITPENCSQVTELKEITILYDYAPNGWSPVISGVYAPDLWNPENPYKKLEVTRNGVTVSTLSVNYFTSYGPTTLNLMFTLDTPQTADGLYEIVIPESYIVDGSHYTTGKQTLRYLIGDGQGGDEPGPEPPKPTGFHLDSMTPADGDMVEELSFISAKWLDSNGEPCVWDGPSELLVKAKSAEGQYFTVAKAMVASGNGGIFFTLNRPYSAYGTAYLTIPAGAVTSKDGSDKNEEDIDLGFSIFYDKGMGMTLSYPAAYSSIDGKMGQSMQTIALQYGSNVSKGLGDTPYMVTQDGEIIDCDSFMVPDLDRTQAVAIFNQADTFKQGRYTFVMPHNALSGVSGNSFYYTFTPMPGQEIPDIPDGTKVELLSCTISGYDMMDPDNGIPFLGVDAPLKITTNLDYASDVCWYKIIDVTDCKSEAEYDYAPAIHSSYFDKSGGSFSGPILSPGGAIRNLTSDRLYCVQAHLYLNYYNAAMRRDWGYGYSAVFRGGSAPYDYADLDVRITPMPGSELTAGQPIVMKFPQPVEFQPLNSGIPQGQEGTISLGASSNDDKTEWTFTVPVGSSDESKLEIHFGFTEIATGRRVRPSAYDVPETETGNASIFNYGEEGRSQIVVVYGSYEGKPEFSVVPAPGSTVRKLHEFSYSFADGDEIMPSWMGTAIVRDQAGNAVASLLCDDMEENGGNVKADYDNPSSPDAKALKLHLRLTAPIEADGEYTIEYPYGYFSKGREKESDFSRPAQHLYIVEGNGTTGVDAVADAAGRYTVVSLQGVTLLREADATALRRVPAGLYIVNGRKMRL